MKVKWAECIDGVNLKMELISWSLNAIDKVFLDIEDVEDVIIYASMIVGMLCLPVALLM